MNFNRRIFLLRYLLLSIVGLLAPLLKSRSSSAQTSPPPVYNNDLTAPTDQNLRVDGAVPGVPQRTEATKKMIKISEHYTVEVREVLTQGKRGPWMEVTAYQTRSQAGDNKPMPAGSPGSDIGYYYHLKDWTHTYVNFEMREGTKVEVQISRLDSTAITAAVVHPNRALKPRTTTSLPNPNPAVAGGKAIVTLIKPCLIAVDINGQMDKNHTGAGYYGDPKAPIAKPAIHTISIFANPLIAKPKTDGTDPNVVRKFPKDGMPQLTGTGKTLVFMPGVHYIQSPSQLKSGCRYYIPGNAIVYGTFNGTEKDGNDPDKDGDGNTNIRIFGHGILSGSMNRHPGFYKTSGKYKTTVVIKDSQGKIIYKIGDMVPYVKDQQIPLDERTREPQQTENNKFRAIAIDSAKGVEIDGITIVDSPQISIEMSGSYQTDIKKQNFVKWVKMIHWRANSDAINTSTNINIEDCFIRNQDDSLGVGNASVKRVVQWNDANGLAFKMGELSKVPTDRDIVIEDCDVIYSRCIFAGGGQVFAIDGKPEGGAPKVYGKRLIFRNIVIEDPKPTKGIFFISLGDPLKDKGPGSVSYEGVTFDTITITALPDDKDLPALFKTSSKPTLRGFSATSEIRNFTFKNLTVGGKKVITNNFIQGTTTEFFELNSFVKGTKFL
jgi:hypothetical protein